VHLHAYLLKIGRLGYFTLDEEEENEELEAIKAEDPEIAALTALSEDQPFIGEKSWIIRVIGDD